MDAQFPELVPSHNSCQHNGPLWELCNIQKGLFDLSYEYFNAILQLGLFSCSQNFIQLHFQGVFTEILIVEDLLSGNYDIWHFFYARRWIGKSIRYHIVNEKEIKDLMSKNSPFFVRSVRIWLVVFLQVLLLMGFMRNRPNQVDFVLHTEQGAVFMNGGFFVHILYFLMAV